MDDTRELIRELAEAVRDTAEGVTRNWAENRARAGIALRRAEAWLAERDKLCRCGHARVAHRMMGTIPCGQCDCGGYCPPDEPHPLAAPASEPVGDQCRPELGIAQAVRFAHDAGARVGELEAQLAERDAEVARLREENEGYRKLHANQFTNLQKRREQNAQLAAELAEAREGLAQTQRDVDAVRRQVGKQLRGFAMEREQRGLAITPAMIRDLSYVVERGPQPAERGED